MFKIAAAILLLAIAVTAGAVYRFVPFAGPSAAGPPMEKSLYEFTVKNIDGQDVKLDAYKGKVMMIVNVASKCGYTPQYGGLQALYQKNKDRGFIVLGFPANNFMGQEPGTEAEIKEFCSTKYNVTFPMFAKISVVGTDQHPLYNFLTNKTTNPEFGGDISWNFNKFLVDRQGNIVARFGPKDTPEGEPITAAVEKYLAKK